MLKNLLRSTLKNTLSAIDKTAKWHDNYLDHILESCITSLVYEAYARDPRALGQYTKRYTAQTITGSGTAGRYYHTLAVSLMALPDKRGGVRGIVSSTGTNTYFAPVTDQELLMMEEAQIDELTTTTPSLIYYVVHPTIIEFKNMNATIAAGTLTLDLLVAFTSLVDTDRVPLPFGAEASVLKMALEILGVTPPKDLLDNNAETWQTRRQQ